MILFKKQKTKTPYFPVDSILLKPLPQEDSWCQLMARSVSQRPDRRRWAAVHDGASVEGLSAPQGLFPHPTGP